MARPELGTKRVCQECGTKFYDLGRMPAPCPNCGTLFEIVEKPVAKEEPKKVVEPTKAKEDEEEEGEIEAEDADLVSLEEAEDDDDDVADDDNTTALIEDDDDDDVVGLVETSDDDDDS